MVRLTELAQRGKASPLSVNNKEFRMRGTTVPAVSARPDRGLGGTTS
jgi:hypothetical protein